MATKTIKTTVTVRLRDDENSIPFEYDQNYAIVKGKHVEIEHLPGSEFTLEASEADRLLARFGGEVVSEQADVQAEKKGGKRGDAGQGAGAQTGGEAGQAGLV